MHARVRERHDKSAHKSRVHIMYRYSYLARVWVFFSPTATKHSATVDSVHPLSRFSKRLLLPFVFLRLAYASASVLHSLCVYEICVVEVAPNERGGCAFNGENMEERFSLRSRLPRL